MPQSKLEAEAPDGTVWAVAGDFMVTLRYALPVDTANPIRSYCHLSRSS